MESPCIANSLPHGRTCKLSALGQVMGGGHCQPVAAPTSAAGGILKIGLACAGVAAAQEIWRRSREKDLRDDVALVSGAGSGIGREMSLLLAKSGCRLVLWGRRAEPLRRVADDIRALAKEDPTICGDVRVDVVDVGVKAEVDAAGASVLGQLGRCDLLINNAGVHEGLGVMERSEADIRAIFDVNVLSHFWTLQCFLPSMLERNHGHVVTVGSAAGVIGLAGLLDYNASKFAVGLCSIAGSSVISDWLLQLLSPCSHLPIVRQVRGMNESLRMQLNKEGSAVRCTLVSPYYIDTGMFDGARTRFPLLLPILKQEDVARKIIKAVRRNAVELQMPPLVYTTDIMRGLFPAWVFDRVVRIVTHPFHDDTFNNNDVASSLVANCWIDNQAVEKTCSVCIACVFGQ